MKNQKQLQQEDNKFLWLVIAICGILLIAGTYNAGIETGKQQGENQTLNNITLMSEVGNAYIIAMANQYNGTIPIVVRDYQLNETQVYTCSNITRIK